MSAASIRSRSPGFVPRSRDFAPRLDEESWPCRDEAGARKDQILDEVRRLPAQERMDVLEGVLELVVPPVSAEQEQGLVEALDEADRGELVDGPEAIAKQRRRVLGAR